MAQCDAKKNPICSVIVPVYQVEPYLPQCLDSILAGVNGMNDETEIILVTGDSHDRSNAICDDYCARYPNVLTLRQDGKGLSNARNYGLRIARGRYIGFLDSDDFISPEYYSRLLNFLQNTTRQFDVLLTDYTRVTEDGRLLERITDLRGYAEPAAVSDSTLQAFLRGRNCFWSVWRYVYRRDFLLGNDIWFLENRTMEDLEFTTRVLLRQQGLLFWHNPYYCYRVWRADSLYTRTEQRLTDVVFMLERALTLTREEPRLFSPELQEQYRMEYFLNIVRLAECEDAAQETYFRKWRTVLGSARSRAVRCGYQFIRLFGLRRTAALLRILKQTRRMGKRMAARLRNLVRRDSF